MYLFCPKVSIPWLILLSGEASRLRVRTSLLCRSESHYHNSETLSTSAADSDDVDGPFATAQVHPLLQRGINRRSRDRNHVGSGSRSAPYIIQVLLLLRHEHEHRLRVMIGLPDWQLFDVNVVVLIYRDVLTAHGHAFVLPCVTVQELFFKVKSLFV